jgi:hypothetical protein
MKRFSCYLLLLSMISASVIAQPRLYQTHQRGMLHQTVYNTGELGRGYDNGVGGMLEGFSSMEWPPNSSIIVDRTRYAGQHSSFGAGVWIAGTVPSGRKYVYCGAVSDANGNPTPVQGVVPIQITRSENYPVLPNGNLNPGYNPSEAEEKIVAQWVASDVGILVTRTSRGWSFPGYDSFIIYEYEFQNTTADTIRDLDFIWTYAIGPSMFGYQRTYNRWGEGDYRGQNGEGNHFTRFDLKRWMTYSHDREGRPDTTYFALWSQPGDRGGLNSPQAAGVAMLYYDHDHLMTKAQRPAQVWPVPNDSLGIWDTGDPNTARVKQPFLLRYENSNLPLTKIQQYLDPTVQRRTGTFVGSADSTRIVTQLKPATVADWLYWRGRTKSSVNLAWYQPVVRFWGFYPYLLPPNQSIRFALAEVVGYGPGVASDRIYSDLGGNIRAGADAGNYFHPIPSWYDTLQYPFLGPKPYIGSRYLQTHPLPWYVTAGNGISAADPTPVISVRDVADRAIQMFTGRPLVKYDTLQYEPINSRPNGVGAYNSIAIPIPAPAITIEDSRSAFNKITWGPQVEEFSAANAGGRLRAPFKHYLAMRATSPLGPWTVIDSITRRDQRYFHDSVYVLRDTASILGEYYSYAVVSVDSLGGRSGMTNMVTHVTQAPPVPALGKVYVVPNPLIVTNGRGSAYDPNGEVTDRLQFFGLTAHCTIRIFSYSGQLIQTIVHDGEFNNPWYQISRNNQLLASGVYYFVVEDVSGARAHGKFVIVH